MDILLAHENVALQTQPCRYRCRRHPMLTGTGFCNDTTLSHMLSQQRLPNGVVHLVRARVIEILAFEINAATPNRIGQSGRLV